MRDINIQVKENHTVDFENDYAGLNRENLQGNIIFNFDKFVSGQARVEIVINNVSGYINLDQVEQTYILPIKSSLLTGNDILMQLVIDEPATYKLTTDTDIDTKKIYYEKVGDNYVQVEHPRKADLGNYYEASIPVWKSETFYLKVGFSINAEETIPEQYPSWIETLNNLINETESAIEQASNVNISATQTQSGATITITNKDGESNSVNITNGADGTDGKDAKINGYNTITIQEGTNIGIEQNGEILTINNTYDDTSIKNDITTLQNTKANKSELSVYSLITETGSKIDLEINSSTYVLTAKLYDKNNNLLSTSTGIDLPLETMVVGASYDSETKEIVLTLKNGQTVRFSVADLVSGLQTEITPSNKLASDLVDDTNQTHKFVSQSEKTQITTNATNIAGIKNGTTINSFSGVESALNTKEDKSNKVTSISSSSTDTQYPSAKCVYDSQTLQDNEISDLKSENDYLNSIINQLPKVSSQGTILTLNNTIAGRMNIELGTSELEQDGTPTPDTPYPIHTISGSNKVVVRGKQLWDEVMENGGYSGSTGEKVSTNYQRNANYIVIPSNTELTLSKPTGKYTRVYFYDKNKTFISAPDVIYTNRNSSTFTTPSNAVYMNIQIDYGSSTYNNDILIETGNSASDYEPYVSQEANINLGDIEYCEIGDYKDEFVRDNEGNWGIRKNIGKDKLTSDNVIYHGVDSYRYQYELTPSQNTIKNEAILSNYFYDYGNTNWWTYDGNIIIQNATVIYMTTTKYTSITAFNNFTSANDVYVYYPLATPTYTPITGDLATQLENIYQYLLSYKGTTNISQINNDLPFNISASALLDLNTLVGE